jgi:hypothetical protein
MSVVHKKVNGRIVLSYPVSARPMLPMAIAVLCTNPARAAGLLLSAVSTNHVKQPSRAGPPPEEDEEKETEAVLALPPWMAS